MTAAAELFSKPNAASAVESPIIAMIAKPQLFVLDA